MRVVHTTLPLDEAHRDAALTHVRRLVAASRRESGVVEYRAAIPVETDDVVQFVEVYETEAAHEAHSETDHYRAFTDALPELVDGDVETTVYEVSNADSATFDATAVAPDD